MSEYLSRRREFLFLYDIRMGNPNGDPDENRPRRLPDGTFYVTDVRLKRFVRDWLKTQGEAILVDRPEDVGHEPDGAGAALPGLQAGGHPCRVRAIPKATANSKEPAKPGGAKEKKAKEKKAKEKMTEGALLQDEGSQETTPDGDDASEESEDKSDAVKSEVAKLSNVKAEAGRLVVSIILKSFIDARLFGSSLAFKDWDIEPRPKTLTGAVQINMGEVLHRPMRSTSPVRRRSPARRRIWRGHSRPFTDCATA